MVHMDVGNCAARHSVRLLHRTIKKEQKWSGFDIGAERKSRREARRIDYFFFLSAYSWLI